MKLNFKNKHIINVDENEEDEQSVEIVIIDNTVCIRQNYMAGNDFNDDSLLVIIIYNKRKVIWFEREVLDTLNNNEKGENYNN